MKHLLLILALVLGISVEAVTIPKGNLYFDNSRTNYAHVQFVYGYDNQNLSYVRTMKYDGEKWIVDIPESVNNIYRYTFANTTLEEGEHAQRFTDLKEYISKTINCNRTATREDYITSGYIFVPESGDNWAQGTWMNLEDWRFTPPTPTSQPSGTLPILFINTENNKEITSKDEYLTATYYLLDTITGMSIGSVDEPKELSIKGRGNYTWTGFDKKPYRIKLVSGEKILGMNKSKHWALMAHADDNLGFLRNTTGYMLSDILGLQWSPSQRPIELVLNGKYWGLYFLTEIIRIDKDRVNITQQEENCTHPDSITGGWLVEIDNYEEEGNISFDEGNGQHIMVTIKDPEIMSWQQRNYITNQLNELNTAFYESSSTHWEKILNLEEAVKYYIVQEIMEDCESYHGSCYLYKDMNKDGKVSQWFFGPVWDFGNSYNRHQNKFIYDDPIWPQYWIGQIASFPSFQQKVKEVWRTFYNQSYAIAQDSIRSMGNAIRYAAANDAIRWKNHGNVCTSADMTKAVASMLSNFNWRVAWLQSQWGNNTDIESIYSTPHSAQKYIQDGNLFILRDGKIYDAHGVRVQ